MPYSLSIAAVLALLLIALSVNVSRLRLRYRVSFGDAGNPALTAAIRAHGNSLEQSMLFILLLYFIDTATSLNSAWVLGLGAGFVVLRLTYCWALFSRRLRGRQVSHGLSMLMLLLTAVMLLSEGVGA